MGSGAMKAGPALLAAFLIYTSWTAMPEKKSKFGATKPPASLITVDMLPLRAADEPPAADFPNPFVSAEEREERRRREEEARRRAEEEAANPAPAVEAPRAPAFRPFVLEIESILRLEDSAVARISGRSVRAGQELRGLDAEQPPVVVRIGEGFVEIRHRGRDYRLDLRRNRSVAVRPESGE